MNIAIPPQLSSLLPNTILANSSGFTLVVSGANIVSGASIEWIAPGGAETTLPGVFIGSSQLQAAIPANLLTASGVAQVGILNPNLTSSGFLPFTITPAVSVSPLSGSGVSQTFSFVFSDANGASDLNSVQVIFNSSFSAVSGCYVFAVPATGAVYLANNADSGFSAPLTLKCGRNPAEQPVLHQRGLLKWRPVGQHLHVELGDRLPGRLRGREERIWFRIADHRRPQFRLANTRLLDRANRRCAASTSRVRVARVGQRPQPDLLFCLLRRQWSIGLGLNASAL